MVPEPLEPIDPEPGEQPVKSWVVEPMRPDGTPGRAGWLVLSSYRIRFFRRAGLLGGGRPERPATFTARLESVRTTPTRYWMKVGYGDRVEMGGVVLDGQGFRLNREVSAQAVCEEIGRWRERRRAQLGLPPL